MEGSVPLSPAAVASVVVVLAAWSDLRGRRIPNPLVLTGLALGLSLNAWASGWNGIALSLAGFCLGLLLMLPGYALHFTGGGDVKLMAAVGSLLGPFGLVHASVFAVFTSAAMAIIQGIYAWTKAGARSPVARYGQMLTLLVRRGRPLYLRPTDDEVLAIKIPLAPAIAIGTLAATWIQW